MERRPGPWPDQPSERRAPRAGREEPLAGAGAGGNLPPWTSLGLGPAPSPGFERDWEPADADLAETADLPDRPPSRLGRGARVLIPATVGLLLVVGAVALVWFDVIGGSNPPTPTAPSAAGRLGAAATTIAGTPRAGPNTGTPAAIQTRTPAATRQPTDAPATGRPASTTAPSPASAATARMPLLLVVGKGDAGGLSGDDLGARLRDALAAQLPGRDVTIVGEDRAEEAAIVVSATAPASGFDARVVAIAPLALVTSPRLPLTGVGSDQANRLLDGRIVDWRDAGAAPSLAVEPVALKGAVPAGMKPVATYKDYAALVAGLARHPGAVALVPLNEVDFRVNVLAVDGVDPLRGIGNVLDYPFGPRLYVGVRSDQAPALKPALDAALATLALPQPAPVVARLGFAGDIVPGRNANQRFGAPGDGTHSFVAVADELASYDLTVANLDGVLSTAADTTGTGFATPFAASPVLTDGLKLAGIDAVSLANDHTAASGTQGLTDTIAALRDAGIASFGAGENLQAARAPFLTVVGGVKVAIIAADGSGANPDGSKTGAAASAAGPGVNPLVASRLRADIGAATKEADVVIAYLTVGIEDQETTPAAAVEAAHAAIDAGAALVVATSPRVVGGIEVYKGRPIVYSLGSLVADQMQSVQTRQGAILEVTIRDSTIAGLRFHGVEIEDFNQPRPMTDAEEAALLDRIWWLSDHLAANG